MSISTEIIRIQTAKADIKSSIEGNGVVVGDGKIDTYAEKIGEAVQCGYNNGFEAGKKAEYDTFWDDFQQNGNRTDYNSAFKTGWTDTVFQPKYDIIIAGHGGAVLFQYSSITKLKSKMDELGLKFDTSQATYLGQMFQGAEIKDVPIIDGRNATSLSYTFGTRSRVETIEKLILSDKLTDVNNAFGQATELTHVIFEGTIATTGLDLHWSTKLDAESYDSLIRCYDKTKALTLTLPAEITVRSVYDARYGSGAWDAITAEYSNLTIAYS